MSFDRTIEPGESVLLIKQPVGECPSCMRVLFGVGHYKVDSLILSRENKVVTLKGNLEKIETIKHVCGQVMRGDPLLDASNTSTKT